MTGTETITITKAEYEELISFKAKHTPAQAKVKPKFRRE
jgi:hypothetical protein